MMPLTRRQRQLKEFIVSSMAENGITPSYAEMAQHFGLTSKGNIARLVESLEERGHIRRGGGRARALEVVDASNSRAVLLTPEIYNLLSAYAGAERIEVETAANALLRSALVVE